jgi:uncharacterized protein YjdB
MRRTSPAILLLAAVTLGNAANNPATGEASDDSVTVNAVFIDAAALQQATGSDFNNAYTVVEVTVTPKGDKPLVLQPDDFLLRINSDSDSSGPMVASQVYGAGSAIVLHGGQETIGITRNDPGYSGISVSKGSASVSKAQIDALQAKMLPAKTTSDPVTGLLFFPLAKKKARNLDLVYTSPLGKLHIRFK